MPADRHAAPRPQPPWPGLLLAALALGLGWAALTLAEQRSPLRRAWAAAEAAGPYRFTGSTAANGAAAGTAIEGRGDGRGRLRIGAPAVAPPGAAADLEVAWPTVRAGDGRSLEPRAAAALLPLGDPLAYLAVGHGARAVGMEAVGEKTCRRWDFLVGGRAYQAWWERHRAFAPFNADAGGMTTFSATGSAWLDPDSQLPCRIALQAELPRTPGEGRGSAAVDWSYAWGP